MKLPLFALHIFVGDCQIADKADDQDRQDQGDLRIKPELLRHGDVVHLGSVRLVFKVPKE